MSLALVCLPSIGVDGSLGDRIECLRSPQCGHVVEIPTFAGCPDGCCGCEVPSPCALGCLPDDWCGWCLLYNLPNDGNDGSLRGPILVSAVFTDVSLSLTR